MTTTIRTRSGRRSARRAIRSAPDFDMLPGLMNTLPIAK